MKSACLDIWWAFALAGSKQALFKKELEQKGAGYAQLPDGNPAPGAYFFIL